jgi:hypothetical protein
MKDKELIIRTLGDMLFQATRASITMGAQYDPGENISADAKQAWKQVAETLVSLVEVKMQEKKEVESQT